MEERPKPTKRMIHEICGGDYNLLSSAHHGLYESPLIDFYPNLNLDETLVFAASSWQSRRKSGEFGRSLKSVDNIYDLFNRVNSDGFPWLNGHKGVSKNLDVLHQKLNPFKGSLRERLERVDCEHVRRLMERLGEEVKEYVFEGNYANAKAIRGGDNSRIIPMGFQPVYPKSRAKIIDNYTAEISKMISSYPVEYEPQESQIPSREDIQMRLF